MNRIIEIALSIKAAILSALTSTKSNPSPPKAKLDGRRGYGDGDAGPPRS